MCHVAWSVCLSVHWSHWCTVQKRPNWLRWHLGLTHVGSRNHAIDEGSRSLKGRGNFGSCPTSWKALGVYAVMCMSKVIIQFSIIAWHAMWPFVKFRCPLVTCVVQRQLCDQWHSHVRVSIVWLCISLFLAHDILETDAARITKLDIVMVHHDSWKPIYFEVKGQGHMAQKTCLCWSLPG